MEVDSFTELAQTYAGMETEQLVFLRLNNTLTDLARMAIDSELRRRDVDLSQYQLIVPQPLSRGARIARRFGFHLGFHVWGWICALLAAVLVPIVAKWLGN